MPSGQFADVLTNQPVVIDNGSGTLKAGFAGQEQPKCFFPNFVGRPKHKKVMMGGLDEDESYIGKQAQEMRGLLKIRYPVAHGIVEDWDDMEMIWKHVYTQELQTTAEENRDVAAEIFFETFNVPAMFTSVQAVLSLYASGRTTGIVLDSGDGVTHAVPVYEGFSMTNAVRRVDVAGRDITEYLQLLLRKSGHYLHTSAEKEVVRTIKEKMCFVAQDFRKQEKELIGKSEEFRLPDGKSIKLASERYWAPEILFNPEIIGLEDMGVHQVIVDSLNRTDLDLRRTLYGNIILSGGSTLCEGFGRRLLEEVKKAAKADTKVKIYAPPERKYSTWIGGSILAGLSTFKKMWISAEEYKDDPDIVHRKSF